MERVLVNDCEAFWKDGMSGEVELNWSWLALYFGILMVSKVATRL
jgi:hypothetical protein